MNKTAKTIITILAIAAGAYVVWYFSSIVIYIILSGVLSIIGQPLVKMIDKVHIGKVKVPHTLSAFITLLIILFVFVSLVSTFTPLIANQAEVISKIDFDSISAGLQQQIAQLESWMLTYGLIAEGESLEGVINKNLESLISFATFSSIMREVLNFTGSIFVGVFSVLFITFFFLKDHHMIFNAIMLLVPIRYQDETANVLIQSKRLLTRYFIGLLFELMSMVTLLSVGLTIFGVRNALLIGFFGGIMNVIPYLGPVIGATIGVFLGVTTHLSLELYSELLPLMATIISVFVVSNLIDNTVLQPLIYSTSVKAHPLEIFLVILIGGSFAGIVGMIFAIPSYTVIRVIAKEFLSRFRIVQKLTERM
ncbi:MAG: AI-2E family transporter [Bacteroidales bacterium]|nr:AI-2E family transporter [Bacteroidales bacterium]